MQACIRDKNEEIEKLEAQIEKMKVCGNGKHLSPCNKEAILERDNNLRCKNRDKWELR